MVRFGQNPSQGTLLKASQFLSEELPIRLSHRIAELEALPDGLNRMPSIEKVKEWYAQSFDVGQSLLYGIGNNRNSVDGRTDLELGTYDIS